MLLNSKSEWGMNSVPRQGTKYKETLWEERPTGKRNRVGVDRDADADGDGEAQVLQGEFSNQYAQRRKRIRLEKATVEETRARDQVMPETEQRISGEKRGAQRKKAPTAKLALEKERKQMEAHRTSLRSWLQAEESRDQHHKE